MTTVRISPLGLAAFHEAGHALACFIFHRQITLVSIAITAAYCEYVAPDHAEHITDAAGIDRIAEDIQIALAGGIAVELMTGQAPDWGIAPDEACAFEMARRVHESEAKARALVEKCRPAVRELLTRLKDDLFALSVALFERHQLTGAQVAEILRKG